MGFPSSSAGEEPACNVGNLGLNPGLGRSPGEKNGYPLQYSGPENSMDCIVHGVAKSWTWLSYFHFHSLWPWAFLIAQLLKNPPAMQETPVQFLGSGRSAGERNACPLQYFDQENFMDCIVHGVAKSWTQMIDFHSHFACSSMGFLRWIRCGSWCL